MRHVLIVYSKYFLILHILLYHLFHSFILRTFNLFTLYFFAHTFAEWQQKCISFFSFSRVSQLHRRKKRQVPAAFWPLFKNVTFEFSTVEPRYSVSFRQQAKSHYIEESHYFEVWLKWTNNQTYYYEIKATKLRTKSCI